MDFEEILYKNLREISERERDEYIKKYGPIKVKEDRWSMDDYFLGFVSMEQKYSSPLDMTIAAFNQRLNCGGYALQVDGCFFPNGAKFSNYVSALLEEFDFIRLIGDTPLMDDEYLVMYRFSDYEENNGRNNGHHFIRANDDGLVEHKCGGETPRIFTGWNSCFENSPEAIFAVKKEHDNLFEDFEFRLGKFYYLNGGLDFDETVCKAIDEMENSFSYHCHDYRLKKSRDGEIFITDENGEIVADYLEEGKERVAIVRAGKEKFVENFSGKIKPKIINGKLINLCEFRKPRDIRDDEER